MYEALANAAEHAFTTQQEPGSMWLHASIADDEVLITITDNGTWRTPDTLPGHRGRGLPLIHQLTTYAHLQLDSQGTTHRAPTTPIAPAARRLGRCRFNGCEAPVAAALHLLTQELLFPRSTTPDQPGG
ncbi:MAG: ATP-binding protein [Actinomycetota bacterium]|nr:ATP-binding protein [Actinomycetota bacterium]